MTEDDLEELLDMMEPTEEEEEEQPQQLTFHDQLNTHWDYVG